MLTSDKESAVMADVPNIKVEPPGPEAKKAVAADDKWLVKATKSWPLVFKKAEGAVIEDVDGNEYIDFYAGVGVLNIGARHPKVVAAVKDQVDKYTHVAGTDFYCRLQNAVAERLAKSSSSGRPPIPIWTWTR